MHGHQKLALRSGCGLRHASHRVIGRMFESMFPQHGIKLPGMCVPPRSSTMLILSNGVLKPDHDAIGDGFVLECTSIHTYRLNRLCQRALARVTMK